jgi:ribosomal protein S18 acetylase RimI-like enzyme
MSDSPYIIRNYQLSDFEDYVKLNLEAEKLEPTGRCISSQTLSENLGRSNYSPEQDLFVAETASEIVGFMNVTPELITKRVLIDCLVYPEHRRRNLAKKLLTYALRRAEELKVKVAHVNIRQNNAVAKQVLSRLSFRVVRQFLELRWSLAEVHLPGVTHHNYTSRHLRPGEEDKLAHGSPHDVILICEEDKVVGYCWTKIECKTGAASSGEKGRIFMLGVEPAYRGKGIGKIALQAGLTYLKNKGVRLVELDVDSENKAACALYRSIGFKRWSSTLWYEKTID